MSPYRAKKRFGQHFLTSEKIIARIIDLVGPKPEQTIVEVGPGRGAMTVPLAQSGARLVAVEFDRDVIPYLEDLVSSYQNVTIVNKDFLTFRPAEQSLSHFALVGNLPYNITSPVIEWTIQNRAVITAAFFMVQKEVAKRITGSPGSKDWSPLAIFTQLHFNATYCFDVARHAFTPPPEVTSAVIRLDPWPNPLKVSDMGALEKVVRVSFRQRRKTLVNNLVPEIIETPDIAKELLAQLNLPENVRAEQVMLGEFVRLADRISRNPSAGALS